MIKTLLRRSNTSCLLRTFSWLLLLAGLPALRPAQAQSLATAYSFSQSMGTYVPLQSPAVVATATQGGFFSMYNQVYRLPNGTIPFPFYFQNVPYTGLSIASSGFIMLGTGGGGFTTSPLSSADSYAAAIAPLGGMIIGSSRQYVLGEVSYQTLGSAPYRTFVVQYKNFKRYPNMDLAELFDLQIRLQETTNRIDMVYNISFMDARGDGGGYQVGLRGATNTDYACRNNLLGTNYGTWLASEAGTSNGDLMALTSGKYPAPGLTYTYTPAPPCAAPGSVTISTIGQTTAGVSFAAAANSTGYTATATPATGPAITTTGTASPLVLTGLAANTTYSVAVTSTCTGGTASSSAPTSFTTLAPDLVISSTQSIPAGTYNTITITGTGTGTLAGNVTVNGALTVQSGGTLNDGCFVITGAGSFELAAGGTLGICNAQGLSGTAGQGVLQNTGSRSLSTDASYVYTGTAAQATGTLLPLQVRNLTTTNANSVTLSGNVGVSQVVTVAGAGNLVSNGALTLLSSATGTALVVNAGTGIVQGTATVQRYIDGSLNAGLGYRHYSIPVLSTSVQDLTTTGYSPVVNPAYNTSATPGLVTPFPTVFGYDETRLPTTTNNLSAFDKGWFSPASLGTTLISGRGYVANVPSTAVIDFQGTLTTGDRPAMSLSRAQSAASLGALAAETGWHLVGNPYPAPLDYSRVMPADRPGLDAAIYVAQSSGQYAGSYRSYVNSIGGNPVLPACQGFFVRVNASNSNGVLTLRNSHRLTSPEATGFQRTTLDLRPLVQLELRTASNQADALYAYAEAGATDAFDSQYDAVKLPNSTGLNLSSTASTQERLAIDGRAAFTAASVLPLNVGVPAAGTYTLNVVQLNNLPAGLDAYLSDAATSQSLKLSVGSSYSFSLTTAQVQALITGRFTLQFKAQALAASAALTPEAISLFPNPAHGSFVVQVPAVASATAVQADLLNTLGQVVRRQSAALPAAGASLSFETGSLAPGVYTLRLQAGASTLAKRVVIQ